MISYHYLKNYGRLSTLSDEFRNQKLDIVYTWVDMCDDNWINIEAQESDKSDEDIQDTLDQCSEYSYKEIDYSILHTLKYAKAVLGTIYIITDNQTPNLLSDPANTNVTKIDNKTFAIDGVTIKIVYHTDIMPAKFLPCYNSTYIESYLHKIPELSNWFIYMNDDVFINKPVTHDWFFLRDNISRLLTTNVNAMPTTLYSSIFGAPNPYMNSGAHSYSVWRSNLLYNQSQNNTLTVYAKHLHVPKIINKNYMNILFNAYESDIERTYSQYRNNTNINITFIYYSAMVDQKLAFYSNDYSEYYLSYTSDTALNQIQFYRLDSINPDFFVINDNNHSPGEILEEDAPKKLNEWLSTRLSY